MHPKALNAALAVGLLVLMGFSVAVDAHRGSGSPDWDLGSPRALTAFDNPAAAPTGGGCGAPSGLKVAPNMPFPCSPATGTAGQPAAVFYPGTNMGVTGGIVVPPAGLNAGNTAFSPLCTSSPACFPNVPLSQASPWFGTPRPSGTGCATVCASGTSFTSIMPTGYDSLLPGPARLPNPCGPSPTTDLILSGSSQAVPYYGDASEYPIVKPGQWSPIESLTNLASSPASFVQADSVANTPWNGPPGTRFYNQYSNPPSTGFGDGRFHLTNESAAQSAFDDVSLTNTLFLANGDPKDVEGAPDDFYVEMGNDGYILGKFAQPVYDQDGYDFRINAVQPQPFGTACVYGATSPTGPFTLVHSLYSDDSACDRTATVPPSPVAGHHLATTDYCPPLPSSVPGYPACPNLESCMSLDLSLFYTPLRTLQGEPQPDRMDYFLIVNSFQHTPYLKNGFTVQRVTAAPMTPVGLAPLRQDARYYFNDTSVRFGYPLWFVLIDCTPGPTCISVDPTNTNADPIVEWNWDFTSDPYSLPSPSPNRPPLDPANPTSLPGFGPADRERRSWRQDFNPRDHNEEHVYISPGIFPVCHSVHTSDQILPTMPVPTLAVWRQSDPPMSDPDPSGNNPGPAAFASPPPNHFAQSPLTPKLPKTKDMHCQTATVYNIAPTPAFAYGATWNDPLTIDFYDLTEDTDWIMPPAADFGPCVTAGKVASLNRCNTPALGGAFDGCCACYDCPPDGVQVRTWDFTSDGIVDYSWHYVAKAGSDARFCSQFVTNPTDPPVVCPQDPTLGPRNNCPPFPTPPPPAARPYCGEPGNQFLLESAAFGFQAGDCHSTNGHEGSWIYGPGIPAGTKIAQVLDARTVRLTKGVFADVLTNSAVGSPFVVACPYESLYDDPQYTYPRPGQYNATLATCDHDYNVTLTARNYGAQAWPAPTPPGTLGRQWGVQGDPYGIASGVAPSPSPLLRTNGVPVAPGTVLDSALPASYLNLHACQALRQPVRIPNHPPTLTVPPTLVVRPNTVVTFSVVGTDTDRGQDLTLRPCQGLDLLPGMSFADVLAPNSRRVSHTVTFNIGALPIGHYGPFCYEVTDGIAVTHAVMHIWVSGDGIDADADGVSDLADNCPSVPNSDQLDSNGDGIGDACQEMAQSFEVTPPQLETFETTDHDGDGIPDASDNCASLANRDQADVDNDLVGDVCDLDADGDGVVNVNDDCPTLPNPLQEDSNKDGVGDICAKLGGPRALPDPVKGGEPNPPTVDNGTWGLVIGSSLGMLAMVAILVPVLVFALRRNRDDRGGDGKQ